MNQNFVNNQHFIDKIPVLADIDFQPMHVNRMYINIINTLIFGLTLLIGGFTSQRIDAPLLEKYNYIIYTGFFIVFLILMIDAIFGFYKMKYALRNRDIIYKKGLIFHKTTIVPFNRVQHCEVSQGPIQRMFGMSSLKLFTAGGASSDLNIRGLTTEEAEKLRNFIIKKTGIDEEE